jgi:sugar lactone lactonase YvrE
VKIPNSIGWSLDHKTLFFTHSTSRVILAYDYTPETGEITNGRPFYTHEGPGEPDGFKVDVEGNLWSAVYGESRVLKINTEGKLVGQILFPAKCITCPVFVGTELYVTSASGGRESEFAGDIFKFDIGVKGVEPFQFKIKEGISKTLTA